MKKRVRIASDDGKTSQNSSCVLNGGDLRIQD